MIWIGILFLLLLFFKQAHSKHRNTRGLSNRGHFSASYKEKRRIREEEKEAEEG